MQIDFGRDFRQTAEAQRIIEQWKNRVNRFTLKSSGTTGQAKPIVLARDLLEWSARQTSAFIGLPKPIQAIVLPIDKTGGFMQLIRALHLQWQSTLLRTDHQPLEQLELDHPFTLISMTPHQLGHSLINSSKLGRFKCVLVGGAAVSVELEERVLQDKNLAETKFLETYGMTETASHIAVRPFGSSEFSLLDGVHLIPENQGTRVEIPEIGLQVFSNDLLDISSTGFRVIGRSDNLINSGGIKIQAESLEKEIAPLLHAMGFNRSFFIAKESDPEYGEIPVLVLEGLPIKQESFVLENLRRSLPKYTYPKRIRYQNEFSRTNTGKLIRNLDTA